LAETPTAQARFEREAKASAQLKSLHICKVQDYGIEGDTPYMVMERLEGEDLAERLGRRGRIPAAELAGIVSQIARALTVAHAAGLVHRDLKPSNVFVVHEGDSEIVKLLDFGIARELGSQLVDERTSSGMVIGSPHHMSPEQAHGQRVDHRSDLWSLGVIMYKALTGSRPFEGEHMTAVMLSIVSKKPAAPSSMCDDLPAGTDAFFERALAREASDRFQSASELAEAFAELSMGSAPAAWLTPAEPRAALPSRSSSISGAASGATPMSGVSPSSEGTG
jgi:eukaryotic-like serine/threonine-protein kinase